MKQLAALQEQIADMKKSQSKEITESNEKRATQSARNETSSRQSDERAVQPQGEAQREPRADQRNCIFWEKGFCNLGSACKYLHTPGITQTPQRCVFFERKGQCYKKDCAYSHEMKKPAT
jgi:hypothetical protein